jgi:uncharacterized protein (DUF433 family)
MARYALSLPSQLKQEAARLAKEQGVSLNQFILWAMSEKVGALRQTLDDPQFPHITYRREVDGYPVAVLRGSGIRVQAIVVYAKGWNMSTEEIAEDFDLPIEAINAALKFYEAHRFEIDAAIEAERQMTAEAGYDHTE